MEERLKRPGLAYAPARMLSLIEQLREIAGVERNVNEFSIQIPGKTEVRVLFSRGSTDTLILSVAFPSPDTAAFPQTAARRPIALPLSAPRPLSIQLTRELSTHVRAKEMGINREVQLGDPTFDGHVYINSPSGDDIIREVLASPDLRAAARDLLEHDASILVIDDAKGRVNVAVIEFHHREPDQSRAERMLQNVHRIAIALPPVSATPGVRQRDWLFTSLVILGIIAFIGLIVATPLYQHLSPEHCLRRGQESVSLVCKAGPECCRPALYGLGAGAGLSVPLAILLFYTVRGQSNSLPKMVSAIVISSALLLEISALLGRILW